MAKFLSYEDRLEIESALKEDLTFTEMGKKLGRDRTTITKKSVTMQLSNAQDIQSILIMYASIEKDAREKKCAEQMNVSIQW